MSSCGRAVLGTQHWKHGKAITRKTFPHEEQRRSAAPASLDSSKSDHYVGDEGAMLSAKQAWRLRLARIPAPFFLMFYRFENCYAIQSRLRVTVICIFALCLGWPHASEAYSVLTHEAIV